MSQPPLVSVELTDDERGLLLCGLLQWCGPARTTDELALAMGFRDTANLFSEVRRLRSALDARAALTVQDWERVLVATEVAFASDVFGSGLDWPITTGIGDADTIALLRAVQRKMPRWRSSYQFTVGADGDVSVSDPDRPPRPRD